MSFACRGRLDATPRRGLSIKFPWPHTHPKEHNNVAVRLRLTRVGKKKQPSYRIVAADSRSPRDGRYLEIVGTYDPRREPSAITVDNDLAVKWLRNGALPSDRVRKLLEISGAWEAFETSKAGR